MSFAGGEWRGTKEEEGGQSKLEAGFRSNVISTFHLACLAWYKDGAAIQRPFFMNILHSLHELNIFHPATRPPDMVQDGRWEWETGVPHGTPGGSGWQFNRLFIGQSFGPRVGPSFGLSGKLKRAYV